MKKIILVLYSQKCEPFPGHTETVPVGHFNTDDTDRLEKTAVRVANSMRYIGGIIPPATQEGQARVICEELVKQGFEPVKIELLTVSI